MPTPLGYTPISLALPGWFGLSLLGPTSTGTAASTCPVSPKFRKSLSRKSSLVQQEALPLLASSLQQWVMPILGSSLQQRCPRRCRTPTDRRPSRPRPACSSWRPTKRLAFSYHLLKFDSQLFHLRTFELHVSGPLRGHPGLSGTRPQTSLSVFVRSNSGCPDRPAV